MRYQQNWFKHVKLVPSKQIKGYIGNKIILLLLYFFKNKSYGNNKGQLKDIFKNLMKIFYCCKSHRHVNHIALLLRRYDTIKTCP